jgi:hypothetical protein
MSLVVWTISCIWEYQTPMKELRMTSFLGLQKHSLILQDFDVSLTCQSVTLEGFFYCFLRKMCYVGGGGSLKQLKIELRNL